MKYKALVLFFLIICLNYRVASAGSFPIKINDVSGLNSPWPIVASISFPEGELTDSTEIRIMNGEREVPSQVDVTATWRDGSIRWALAGFTASPQGNYRAEFGEGIKKGRYPTPLKVTRQKDGGFEINTGVAIYRFDKEKLLPEDGWLISGKERIQILKNSGSGTYLIDNSGRRATVSGTGSEIEGTFIKEGTGRVVVRRSGWYITSTGEKVAKADVWFYFSAGVPYIRITHSLLFTENTNKVWFKDYGLEFKTPEGPRNVYCAVGKDSQEVQKIENEGEEVFLLQAEYPHFAEREYKATIGKSINSRDTVLKEIGTAGDWAHGDYGSFGITLVMPWLAERFPKEISFGERGARAVLWSGRSGKELDFRVKTLVKDYYGIWVTGIKSLRTKELDEVVSNAQGTARTHDIWFLPHIGKYSEQAVKQSGIAGARQILAIADPEWLCETEAMGYPMLHKDEKRFPDEEFLISEYWDRFIIPLKAFPMMGYISWGCYPDRSYGERGGKPMSTFHAISTLREYGVRREPWRHFARSGERRYYDYGHRFSRFTGDWYLAHTDAPGSPGKQKGGFISSPGGGGRAGLLPLFWGDRARPFGINAGDIGHWLLEYYLTGDEYSKDLLNLVKETFEKVEWNPKYFGTAQFQAVGMRTLLTFYIMDWDENAGRVLKDHINRIVDMESQNGSCLFKNSYGSMYKDHRLSHNVLEYYLETRDELAKEAFIKLLDQRYRFDRRQAPVSYKNYDAFTHSIGYWLTGDKRFRSVVEQTVRDALYYTKLRPLAEDLKQKENDPLEWPNLYVSPPFSGPRTSFYMAHHEYHNPFIGMPTALKFLSKEGWSGATTPLLIKSMKNPDVKILFDHTEGEKTRLSIFVKSRRKNLLLPEVIPYPYDTNSKPLDKIKIDVEEQMPPGKIYLEREKITPPKSWYYHLYVTVPKEIPTGLYLISFNEKDTFALLDTTSKTASLYCPEGFWPICVGEHIGTNARGIPGEGRPAYFKVPKDLKELEILIGRPVRVKAPDGSVVIEWSDKNIGKMSIPVLGRGGSWSIEYYSSSFRGTTTPCFVKLLNVEPVISFGSPELLPEKTTEIVPTSLTEIEPSLQLEFVNGISGKAVKLSGDTSISYTIGDSFQEGYTFFPEEKGTVEFWFRPNWSTWEIPIQMSNEKSISFLKGPFINLFHEYKSKLGFRNIYGSLNITVQEKTKGAISAGSKGRYFFREGEWHHIAYTWDIKKGTSKMDGELNVFLDGKMMARSSSPYPLPLLKGAKLFELADTCKEVIIGPFNGTMDLLRISDVIRYKEDFEAPKDYGLDNNTRTFFNFDGSLTGVSAFSKDKVEAKEAE